MTLFIMLNEVKVKRHMHENGQLKGAEEEIVTEIDTVAGIICI